MEQDITPMDMETNAEACVLGTMFQFPEKQSWIFDNCLPDFFTDIKNKKIFTTALKMYNQGEQIDNVLVAEELKWDNSDEEFKKECDLRIFDLTNYPVPASALIKKYRNILFERSLKRLIDNAKSVEDFENIQKYKEYCTLAENSFKHISDGAENFMDRYKNMGNTKITTCYEEIDENIGSFQGGDYIALGGNTGVGKTSVALNIARMVCMQGKKVMYCSLEMPIEQIRNRFNCINTGLNAMKYRNGGFTKDELERYKLGLEELSEWNLYLSCDYNLTPNKLENIIKEKKKTGLDFVIIDYLGLMSGYTNKSMYEKTTIISRQLKILATQYNIPVLVLVQLNRSPKDRQDKRPLLSDIRESGAIEQDADFVLFAYRDYVYNEKANPKDLEIIISKNRHGTSNVKCVLDFNLSTQEISSRRLGLYATTPWAGGM